MVGRRVNAAPGEAYAPERLKPGSHHLLSRQRCGTVSTFERRRKETRERKALQGIGRPESAAFSECLDFRAAKQGRARLSTPFHKNKCRTGRVFRTKRPSPLPSPVRREREQPDSSLAASKAVGYADRRRTILPLPSDGRAGVRGAPQSEFQGFNCRVQRS